MVKSKSLQLWNNFLPLCAQCRHRCHHNLLCCGLNYCGKNCCTHCKRCGKYLSEENHDQPRIQYECQICCFTRTTSTDSTEPYLACGNPSCPMVFCPPCRIKKIKSTETDLDDSSLVCPYCRTYLIVDTLGSETIAPKFNKKKEEDEGCFVDINSICGVPPMDYEESAEQTYDELRDIFESRIRSGLRRSIFKTLRSCVKKRLINLISSDSESSGSEEQGNNPTNLPNDIYFARGRGRGRGRPRGRPRGRGRGNRGGR